MIVFSLPATRSMEDNAPRPMLISLPINVAMQHQRSPSYDTEESGEEQQREQRVVPRAYNPNTDSDYPQEDNQNSNNNNNNNPGSSFLTWNPGNKFVMLQISDYIGSRNQEPVESEEQERVVDTTVRKQRRRPSQGSFDFEDYGRMSAGPRRRPDRVKKQRSSSASNERKLKSKHQDPDDEEEDGDVYGTDPVVHYLKEKKRKSKKRNFDFRDMDDEDDFNMKDWWQY